jgi:hypothetical protein
MDLNQMYTLARSKSYFSRSDAEIFAALNEGSRYVFQNILKENKGYFIKWDTTTVEIVPNVLEYQLPADLEQILRVRERTSASDNWRVIRNDPSLTSYTQLLDSATSYIGSCYDTTESQFMFFGPYEPQSVASDADDDETYNIRFSPNPIDTRTVELVYTAKFVEVTGTGSHLVIPDDGRGAVLDYAVAELLTLNGDDRAGQFYQNAERKLTMFLTLVRDRQLQDPPQVEPYLSDLD